MKDLERRVVAMAKSIGHGMSHIIQEHNFFNQNFTSSKHPWHSGQCWELSLNLNHPTAIFLGSIKWKHNANAPSPLDFS